jgi:drug/metabolite transporter (DMT)-like permease
VLGIASTGVGFFLISTGMRRLSAGLAGTITGITPLFNLFVAHLVLGEPLSPYLVFSGVLIFAGLAGIVQAERLGAAARP